MTPLPPFPPHLLTDYLAGECSPDERAQVEHWRSADPSHAAELDRLREVWTGSQTSSRLRFDVDAMVANVAERLEVSAPRAAQAPATRPVSSASRATPRRWMGVAAVAAAVVLMLGGIVWFRREPAASITQYATSTGQRTVVTLADGSIVTLAPRTTLRLDDAFGRASRTVQLDGEAYFQVAASSRAPFIVRTTGATTRVLGTAFGVRHYADDVTTRVAVDQGKVSVSTSERGEGATLVAGMRALVTDSAIVVRRDADTLDNAWVRGLLVFRNAPLRDVIDALGKWYGYRVRVTDSTLNRQLVTVGLSTESAAKALTSLKLTLDADLSVDGDIVILSPRRNSRGPSAQPRDWRRDSLSHNPEVGR